MEAWIKPEATDGLRNIVAHGYTRSPDAEVFLRIRDGYYEVGSWDGTRHSAWYPVPAEDLNNWVHLRGTYDGAMWRLFRNGVVVSSTQDAIGAVSVSGDWAVGAKGGGGERFFEGSIDEVTIYSRAVPM